MIARTPGHALIHAPVLTTARLILRAPEAKDFDAYAAFWASPRARFIGGPMDRTVAWRGFAADLGQWLIRGYGMFALIDRDSGALVGVAGFWHPEGWPEPDLGYALFEGFEGRGFASEAALRLRSFARDVIGIERPASFIHPENARSVALAERLGAEAESDWTTPAGAPRRIWRHPAAEAA